MLAMCWVKLIFIVAISWKQRLNVLYYIYVPTTFVTFFTVPLTMRVRNEPDQYRKIVWARQNIQRVSKCVKFQDFLKSKSARWFQASNGQALDNSEIPISQKITFHYQHSRERTDIFWNSGRWARSGPKELLRPTNCCSHLWTNWIEALPTNMRIARKSQDVSGNKEFNDSSILWQRLCALCWFDMIGTAYCSICIPEKFQIWCDIGTVQRIASEISQRKNFRSTMKDGTSR